MLDPVTVSSMEEFEGVRVLVTGACGTVGSEIVDQVRAAGAAEIIGIDNNEAQVFFDSERYKDDPSVEIVLADLRNALKLRDRMDGVDVVLHAAALKNVPVCEESPNEAIDTNVVGTQNVIDAAIAVGVQRVLFTSTDKAVNPTTVMGTSKLMAERLTTAANAQRRGSTPVFASTRFGNVLGSAGSVLPLFKRQITAGGPVTLTDPGMTRFIMTLADATALVLQSLFMARGGEVFITKMPVARIDHLAEVMIEEIAPASGLDPASVPIEIIGSRPGEKLYEELMNTEEVRRAVDIGDFLVVRPALASKYRFVDYTWPDEVPADNAYNSEHEAAMSKEELREYLLVNGLLEL